LICVFLSTPSLSLPLFYFAGRDCICPPVQIAWLVAIAHCELFERGIFFYVMRNEYSREVSKNDTDPKESAIVQINQMTLFFFFNNGY